jgi:epoxyqueuosine reductase QueG
MGDLKDANMREKIEQTAKAKGFARCYFLPCEPLERHRSESQKPGQDEYAAKLPHDPLSVYPWAKCVLLLVWAYRPFKPGERIPSYYLASNRAYHAAGDVLSEIKAPGARAERIELPARSLALQNGIGSAGKNGLLSLCGLGTRIALYTLVTDACGPVRPSEPPAADCGSCRACAIACPADAIGENGLTPVKCMRYEMETEDHPDWVKAVMPGYLGCEICQQVCPKNACLPLDEPTDEDKKAFDMTGLLAGNDREARKLVGKNITGKGKLVNEARVFAKRDGLI